MNREKAVETMMNSVNVLIILMIVLLYVATGTTVGDDAVAALIARIRALSESLSVPHSIRAYEGGFVTEDEFLEKVDAISALAVSDACTGSNPRPIDPQQMRELLLACYYDADVHI